MIPLFNYPELSAVGIMPSVIEFTVWNRCGATVVLGDCLMADHLATDGSVSTASTVKWGDDNHWASNFINPATNGIGGLSGAATTFGTYSIFGIVTDLQHGDRSSGKVPGADDTRVTVTVWGPLEKVQTDNSAILFQSPLIPVNGVRTLTLATNATPGILRVARAQQPNGGVAGKYPAFFNGLGIPFLGTGQQFAS